jgi:hypothetical protein
VQEKKECVWVPIFFAAKQRKENESLILTDGVMRTRLFEVTKKLNPET